MTEPQSTSLAPHACRRTRRSGGFTLIEAALTTVIVGTGVLAMVAAQQAYHIKNNWAQQTGTAQLLANEMRELTLSLPIRDPQVFSEIGPSSSETSVADFDNVYDFAGTIDGVGQGAGLTFGDGGDHAGPVNALGQVVPGMSRWSQRITVANVRRENVGVDHEFTQPLGTTDLVRIKVDVLYRDPQTNQQSTMTSMTWIEGG